MDKYFANSLLQRKTTKKSSGKQNLEKQKWPKKQKSWQKRLPCLVEEANPQIKNVINRNKLAKKEVNAEHKDSLSQILQALCVLCVLPHKDSETSTEKTQEKSSINTCNPAASHTRATVCVQHIITLLLTNTVHCSHLLH